MKNLTEVDIIEALRQVYNEKLTNIAQEIDVYLGGKKSANIKVIGPEFKVRHKKSKYLYTVDGIIDDKVILRTPELTIFEIDIDEFEKEYEAD